MHETRATKSPWTCAAALISLAGALGCGDCSRSHGESLQQVTNELTQAAAVKEEAPGRTETCAECEERLCRNYRGLGVDLVAGCFHDKDPNKVKACTEAVECGRKNGCGFTDRGAEQCYCGSAKTKDCAKGTGIDGPCKAQIETAAGNTGYEFITLHFGDRSLALGNAVFMLQCDRDLCGRACRPK